MVLAAVGTLAYEGYVLWWLAFGLSAEHPAPETVAAAEEASRGLTLTVLVPWAAAAIVIRPHLRVVVTALVCAAPALWYWCDIQAMGVE